MEVLVTRQTDRLVDIYTEKRKKTDRLIIIHNYKIEKGLMIVRETAAQ